MPTDRARGVSARGVSARDVSARDAAGRDAPSRGASQGRGTGRLAIWGILNVTPDSFSDGGRFETCDAALAHGLRLAAEGADVLDIGGESTRPGARPVGTDEESARVVPVITALRGAGVAIPLSVDTRRAAVAEAAIAAGATIVNDVSAGLHDPALFEVVAAHGVDLVLMHMQGTPETMQDEPHYDDVVEEVRALLRNRVEAARRAGITADHLVVDPGLGFGKTLAHNVELLRRLEDLVADEIPVLVGASRKSFLGLLTGREVGERVPASLACVARAADAGAAAVRVHDVAASADVARVWQKIREAGSRHTG